MRWSREPAAWVTVLAAVLTLVATFGVEWLTAEHLPLWLAAIDAVAALVIVIRVWPPAPALITGAVVTVGALVVGYGVQVSDETLGAINFFALSIFMLVRDQQSPKGDLAPTTPRVGPVR
jgi:hypothetical protein